MRSPRVIGFLIAGLAFAGEDPGQTAVRHLEHVRAGNVNLEPGKDTALSPVTGDDKREAIAGRLQRWRGELGPEPFIALEVKTDGEFAAALVKQESPFDLSELRVEPVALLRKGDNWLAAPLPGSFENTSVGYDANRSRRQAELAAWLRARQPLALEELRSSANERLRRRIGEKVNANDLRTDPPASLAHRFLSACRQRDAATLLGLMGGLSDPPFGGAGETPANLNRLFSGKPDTSEWRHFLSPEVIVSLLGETIEGESARISFGVLDATPGKTEASHFSTGELVFHRDPDGTWRLIWPAQPDEPLRGTESQNESLSRMPAKLRASFPPAAFATAAAIRDALPAALLQPDSTAALPLMDLSGEPETTCNRLLAFASVRHRLPVPVALPFIPLALQEEGDRAIAAYQLFRPREPGRADLRLFHFKKSSPGWLWYPEGAVNKSFASLNAFAEREKAGWENEWQRRLRSSSVALDSLASAEAPEDAAALDAFTRWRVALTKDDPFGALARTAYLSTGEDEPSKLLRNFGYEWIAARQPNAPPVKVLGIVRHGRWAGISIRTDKSGDAADYPLYPVVQTPSGPRLLLEVDLVAGGDRTRDFLNEASLQRLGANPEALAELRRLFLLHRQLADADRARTP
ncbi:MAG TPA: hypothetical protein VIM57_06640 [Luteolibacter sp.]